MTKARDIANAGTALTSVSSTELGYLDGVSSAVQTQLNTKAVYPSQTGNSGKYLTTDGSNASWGTVSSGGLILIGTTTLSGSSSFNISNIFSSTYDNYLIIGSEILGSGSSYFTFGLRTGTSNATTNYSGGQAGYAYTGSSVGSGSSGGGAIGSFDFTTGDANTGGFVLNLNNPFVAKGTSFFYNFAQYNYQASRGGVHLSATSYDSLWFSINSGTISGKISVYGYAK